MNHGGGLGSLERYAPTLWPLWGEGHGDRRLEKGEGGPCGNEGQPIGVREALSSHGLGKKNLPKTYDGAEGQWAVWIKPGRKEAVGSKSGHS